METLVDLVDDIRFTVCILILFFFFVIDFVCMRMNKRKESIL